MMRDTVQTIGNLIDRQKVSFISSVDEEGFPNMKAMLSPRKREEIKQFYFSTNTSSMRVRQFRENPKASIYFCDTRFYRGVMLVRRPTWRTPGWRRCPSCVTIRNCRNRNWNGTTAPLSGDCRNASPARPPSASFRQFPRRSDFRSHEYRR